MKKSQNQNKKSQKTNYSRLSLEERIQIELLIKKAIPVKEIAYILQRSRNTIYYELRRCSSMYKALNAHSYAITKVKDKNYQNYKIERNTELKSYITNELEKHGSVDGLVGRWNVHNSPTITNETVYTWLRSPYGQYYCKYLPTQLYTRKRRNRFKSIKWTRIQGIPLKERDGLINNRTVMGHFESDLVESPKGCSIHLSTTQERTSRYIIADKVLNKSCTQKQQAISLVEKSLVVSSLTVDQGSENSSLFKNCDYPLYLTEKGKPYQKGGIEHANKLLRRYFPKGTEFKYIPYSNIQKAVWRINHMPRKILGYKTAYEVAKERGLFRDPDYTE